MNWRFEIDPPGAWDSNVSGFMVRVQNEMEKHGLRRIVVEIEGDVQAKKDPRNTWGDEST